MDSMWDELEAVLAENEPGLASALRAGASAKQIADAEVQLGRALPPDLRTAYLRHDGCQAGGPDFFAFGFQWCSLDKLVQHWRIHREVEADLRQEEPDLFLEEDESWRERQVRPLYYEPGWLPIGLTNTTSTLFCDLAPAARGRVGQLIVADGDGLFRVVETSFNSYLEAFIQRLKQREIRYSAERGLWLDAVADRRVFKVDWAVMRGHPEFR